MDSAVATATLYERFTALREELSRCILGQAGLVDRLLIALLADGHLLVEGAPGLAKTTAIKALSERVDTRFQRIQFTPDLLPADLTGTEIFRPQQGNFEFQPGPLLNNLILADEINRAPAKVQSALLEAMAERQITVGRVTYPLPGLFLVMATQNPIEQEGTYPLPEAQLDRFLLHVRIDYPSADTELAILRLVRDRERSLLRQQTEVPLKLSTEEVLAARAAVLDLHLSEGLERYLVELVLATRNPGRFDPKLARWVAWGASPRASAALERTARAHAWLQGRDYVAPEDIRALAPDVLRHRVLLRYEAEAEGVDTDAVVRRLLECVPLP